MSNKYAYVDWFCDGCGTYMNDQEGFTTASGRWRCKNCDYDNDVTDDNIIPDTASRSSKNSGDDIPKGCAACGGPYPLCKDGCPIFDDD